MGVIDFLDDFSVGYLFGIIGIDKYIFDWVVLWKGGILDYFQVFFLCFFGKVQ